MSRYNRVCHARVELNYTRYTTGKVQHLGTGPMALSLHGKLKFATCVGNYKLVCNVSTISSLLVCLTANINLHCVKSCTFAIYLCAYVVQHFDG